MSPPGREGTRADRPDGGLPSAAVGHRRRPASSLSSTLAASFTPSLVTMTGLWKQPVSVETLTRIHENTAPERLGIEFLEVGDDFIKARVPVDERTRQPYGILHGGVSVVLAETLGSTGAAFACPPGHRPVGLDINANHLRSASSGWVTGVARPVHVGRSTQVWQIEMTNDDGQLVCVSRLTLAILAARE